MSLPGFDELARRADSRAEPVRVVAAGGADPTVLAALSRAFACGWVRPVVTGPIADIERVAAQERIALDGFELLEDEKDSAVAAVGCIRSGRAALLMKGQIPTPSLMKAVLDREQGLRTGRAIAQIVLMEILRDGRRFLMTDTGVMVAPTLEQKGDLLGSLLTVARRLGVEAPRVAVMSATEKPTDAMPDTHDAMELSRRGAEGEFGPCHVAGPLSFDLAYASEAGERKRIEGEVTGRADAMLFPNLLAANLTVKGIMYTADCRFGGILCGAACPIVFMSRADSVETRLHSLAYALALL